MGIVVLLGGVVLVIFAIAGLFGGAPVAASRRLATRSPVAAIASGLIGVICIAIGTVLLQRGL